MMTLVSTWFARNRIALGMGLTVAVILLLGLVLNQCAHRDARRAAVVQAEQTTKSGKAIADAASVAVEAVDARHSAEQQIDAATTIAIGEIEDAQSSDDVHAAVTRAVCERVRASGRTDPACVVRKADPR